MNNNINTALHASATEQQSPGHYMLMTSKYWRPVNMTPRERLARTGSGVVAIDQLRFLAGCRKSRLNQALSVLSLSLDFFSVSVVLLTRATLALCYYATAPIGRRH